MTSEARRLKTKAKNKAWRTPEARALRALYPHGDGCLSRDTSGGICDCDALRLRREHSAKEVAVAPAGLDTTAMRAVFADVEDERVHQHARWGQQDLPDGTGLFGDDKQRDAAQAWCRLRATAGKLDFRAVLSEEVYEAFAETDDERLEAELIQVAAVAVQWVEAIRRRRAKADVDASVRAQLGGGR